MSIEAKEAVQKDRRTLFREKCHRTMTFQGKKLNYDKLFNPKLRPKKVDKKPKKFVLDEYDGEEEEKNPEENDSFPKPIINGTSNLRNSQIYSIKNNTFFKRMKMRLNDDPLKEKSDSDSDSNSSINSSNKLEKIEEVYESECLSNIMEFRKNLSSIKNSFTFKIANEDNQDKSRLLSQYIKDCEEEEKRMLRSLRPLRILGYKPKKGNL